MLGEFSCIIAAADWVKPGCKFEVFSLERLNIYIMTSGQGIFDC